ncbi:MAG: hypothetical protein K0R10_2470 [Alphaproteobacteria bacterium]|jgi:hypothetical protein|nr:hypothetical protein [Alphaproteobacteria bacterium]
MEQDNPIRVPLMILAMVLIVSGALLVMAFGYAAWQMIYHPENVEGLKYLFGKAMPGSEAPAFTFTDDGHVRKLEMNESVKMFFTIFLGIMVFRALIGVGGALTGTGVTILRVLDALSPKKPRRDNEPTIPL